MADSVDAYFRSQGGAMYTYSSSVSIVGCSFTSNSAVRSPQCISQPARDINMANVIFVFVPY